MRQRSNGIRSWSGVFLAVIPTACNSLSSDPTNDRETGTLQVHVEPEGTGSVALDPPGRTYAMGTDVTLTATPIAGFRFDVFVDETGLRVSSEPAYVLTIERDVALSARFVPELENALVLSVAASPSDGGTITVEPSGRAFDPGTIVTLTATAAVGFEFAGYSGDATSSNSTASIIMNSDKMIVAEFVPKTFSVEVEVEPPGSGSVTVEPPGGTYEFGTIVTVTASPAPGFALDRFVDEGQATVGVQPQIEFVAKANVGMTAVFVRIAPPGTFSLATRVQPGDAGTVSLDPPGGVYESGTVVTLTAAPSPGYAFSHYSGGVSSAKRVVTLTMVADTTITADFVWSPALGNPGNLLVAGYQSKNVTEFDRFDGTRLGEIVPAGGGGISAAGAVDFGLDGHLYVANVGIDTDTGILRYDGKTGAFIDTFVAGSLRIGFFTLTFGPDGNIFVPYALDNSIHEYDGTTGDLVRVFVAPGAGGLSAALGLDFGPSGNLFVASKNTDQILEYSGTTGRFAGVFVDFRAAGFAIPVDLVFDEAGDLFVPVSGDDGVVRVDAVSGEITRFVEPGAGGLDSPAGILFHPDTGTLLLVSQGSDAVLEFDGSTGDFVRVFAQSLDGDNPVFMAFRPQ